MNVKELNDYENWFQSTPDKIAMAAKTLGGWQVVFPGAPPMWANKVRNYFNVLPNCLTRVNEKTAKALLNRAESLPFLVEAHYEQRMVESANNRRRDTYKWKVSPGHQVNIPQHVKDMGTFERLAQENALTSNVYLDERNRVWYQMAAGSTIYHFGARPENPTLDAVYQDKILGQNDTPVFKLVCPDDTRGSQEVIIFNDYINDDKYNNRSTSIGKVGQKLNVRAAIETDPEFQGSYNYSETTRVGLGAHETRDVNPHPHSGASTFYVNPTDPFSELSSRRFPIFDNQGQLLAPQK